MVRSAAVALTKANGAAGLIATVRKATYLGGHWEYTLDTPFGALFLAQPVGKKFEQGATRRAAAGPAAPVGRGANLTRVLVETCGQVGTTRRSGKKVNHPVDKRRADGLATCPCYTRFIGRPPNPVQWAFLKGPEA